MKNKFLNNRMKNILSIDRNEPYTKRRRDFKAPIDEFFEIAYSYVKKYHSIF